MTVHYNQHRLAQVKARMKELEDEIKIAKDRREYARMNELIYEYNKLLNFFKKKEDE